MYRFYSFSKAGRWWAGYNLLERSNVIQFTEEVFGDRPGPDSCDNVV